jgi:hypothetical protein
MSESLYKSKYLKYKYKYLELKGGLIGKPIVEKLNKTHPPYLIPDELNEYVRMITIPDTEVIRVGSSILAIQPYFSDVDIMNIVNKQMSTDDLITFFIERLKQIVSNMQQRTDLFFSDFKAGGLHWSIDEILREDKNGLSLRSACKIAGVIKLDMIAPYQGRYLEMSTFFILISNSGKINVDTNYFKKLPKTLLGDIKDYKTKKPFKAIKRAWSLARLTNDKETFISLQSLINSNVALLAQVNANIETLELLINHGSNFNIRFTIDMVDKFKERLSHIIDINFDIEKVAILIDNIKYLLEKFSNNLNDLNKTKLLSALKHLHDFLLSVINTETNSYLTHINYNFPQSANSKPDEIDGNSLPNHQ